MLPGDVVSLSSRDWMGRYRLVKLLRASRTCQVWEGMNSENESHVALKILNRDLCSDRVLVASMKHEFMVGSEMDHENVVRHFEFDFAQNVPYIVLEFFTVRNVMQALQTLGSEKLAPIIHEVLLKCAKGLEYFHSQNWIHRDIKPENFLINDKGKVKLIDFALAIQRPKSGFQLGRLFRPRGPVQGTHSYMSPEQIRGKQLDVMADIYSFGCMAYRLISGKPPYSAESSNELLNRHLKSGIPSLATFSDNITSEFADLIIKMMAKNPEQRIASMRDVVRELSRVRIFKTPPGRVVPQKKI